MAKQRAPREFDELRRKAEKLLAEKGEKVSRIPLRDDVQDLSHELSVYHIELEMQNDELRRSQEQLEESRSRYFDLYENAPVGYLTLDEKGLVLDLNLTATYLLGLERTFLLKKPFSPLIAPECQDIFYLHRRHVLRSPGTYTCELMLRRKKGGEPFFHAQLESIAVPSHGTMVIRTVLTDITEIKRLEDEVRQARKMATIGQFADGMAHDFKNVLSVITCYSDLIRTGMEKDDPSQAYLDQIAASSHEAASFVRSLMAFSRKDHANPEVCNVNDVVGRMGEVLRRLLRENIELRLKLTSEYLMTMIDAVQMDQVLMNLAANATDAMPGGGVLTIETGTMAIDKTFVRAKGYGEPGRYVLLSVSDSGIGMDETTKARVFEPFFTTKDAGSGTGLGLSTVYDIVRHNNGYITVSSKPRQGTMFSICLPLIGAERQHDLPSRK